MDMENLEMKNETLEQADLAVLNTPEAIGYMTGFQDGVNAILSEMSATEWLKDYDSLAAVKNFALAYREFKAMQDAAEHPELLNEKQN